MKFRKISDQRAVLEQFLSRMLILRIFGLIILLALMLTAIDIRDTDFPIIMWCLGLTLSWHLLFARSRISIDLKSDTFEFNASSLYLLSTRCYRLSEIDSVIVCKHPFKRGYHHLVIEFNNLAKMPIADSADQQYLQDIAKQLAHFSGVNVSFN